MAGPAAGLGPVENATSGDIGPHFMLQPRSGFPPLSKYSCETIRCLVGEGLHEAAVVFGVVDGAAAWPRAVRAQRGNDAGR